MMTAMCQVLDSCESTVFINSIAHPTGRLNRGIRFALFVAFLQWVQQFFYLFPKWHRGLLSTPFGKIWGLISMSIWPLALSRFAQWTLLPAGTGTTQRVLGHLPHYSVDVVIMIVLKVWMAVTCYCVFQRPELSGFDRRRRLIEDAL
jgi:hypothetical protein